MTIYLRQVESKEFRRTPGLSDFGEETPEQRRLREMILHHARQPSPREDETVKPQHRVISRKMTSLACNRKLQISSAHRIPPNSINQSVMNQSISQSVNQYSQTPNSVAL